MSDPDGRVGVQRAAVLFGIAVVAVFLISAVLAPTFGGPAVSRATAGSAPHALEGAPSSAPSANCSAGPGLVVNLSISGASNLSRTYDHVGLAPATANLTLAITSQPENFSYTLSYGDGGFSNGSVLLATPGTVDVNFTHTYQLPAAYYALVQVTYTCSSGNYTSEGGSGEGISLLVGGPGGYYPVSVTANVTHGSVPLSVQYVATINDTPSNATIIWDFFGGAFGSRTYLNVSTLNLTWDAPGLIYGFVYVYYPSGALLYGDAVVPQVGVAPIVELQVNESAPTMGNDWERLTFFANATNLTGGPYTGPGNLEWNFGNVTGFNGTPLVVRSGPTNGSEVTENFSAVAGFTGYLGADALVSFVDPAAVTLGWGTVYYSLNFGASRGGGTGTMLSITASPATGSAPFNTTVRVTSNPYPLPPPNIYLNNSSYQYSLVVCLQSASAGINGSCAAPIATVNYWNGSTVALPVTGLVPGTYYVVARLWLTAGSNASEIGVTANVTTLTVSGPSSIGAGPLSLSVTGTPSNGSVPLAAFLGMQAGGGAAPYDVSACLEGPSSTPNVTGVCNAIAASTGWNGSLMTIPLTLNQTGYYLAIVTLTDSNGTTANATATFQVNAVPIAAPLVVQGSELSSAAAPGSYTFRATVQGGVAPYSIQWAFGDGTFGSSAPDGTVSHTYTASGTYTATLTVIDAAGTVKTSTLGPLVVALPSTSGTSPLLSGGSLGIVAVSLAIIVASLVVIAYTARAAAERRRTQAWLASIDPPASGGQPPSKPGP
jgi:PKD repeat protein